MIDLRSASGAEVIDVDVAQRIITVIAVPYGETCDDFLSRAGVARNL
jgi:hypothetical protein